MRVTVRPTQVGDVRYTVKFAWFTKYLNRQDERGYEIGVWMERYVIVEEYQYDSNLIYCQHHWHEVHIYTWKEWKAIFFDKDLGPYPKQIRIVWELPEDKLGKVPMPARMTDREKIFMGVKRVI